MKKILSFFLTLMMVLTLACSVSAAGTGSVTISGVSLNADGTLGSKVYSIYKLLDLESYDTTSGTYAYKVVEEWKTFFTNGEGANYFSIDKSGYVTIKDGVGKAEMPEFSQKALAYAVENRIHPAVSTEDDEAYDIGTGSDGKTTLKFESLELGYYLVDSTVGALCSLTTTNPDAVITAKNTVPIIDKQVQEDQGGKWGDSNTADIGQIVNFMTDIHVSAGAQNYVLHDSMDEGLTYQKIDRITLIKSNTNDVITLEVNRDYKLLEGNCACGCTFAVDFDEKFEATLGANDRITVYYSAMLNRYATIAGDGNINQSWLEYGEDNYTTHDQAKTYTFSIDIVKTDTQNTLIDGAEFRIYDAETDGNEIAVVPLLEKDDVTPVQDKNGNPIYRRARADETGVSIVVKDGQVTIVGFDNGDYYLEETKAPAGYNKLSARQAFTISDANLSAVYSGNIHATGSGVHVVNKSGTMLPETGARGTALFITFGMIVVLGAGVLLVTKKRMGMIQD